ncbi:ABC transporter permease [Bacillus cereus]|uniref:ABC transporter permease n=1 Tax=Bacillus cereus TaxID=1396 RepID=UPI001298C31A|nr:ABC transporter permease [Bacillus cereus]MRB78341.1 ABC transporter permease subunit [Bacillus thuringiensis]MBJ7937493.1 ABC transporter permease [Bacillus cereus]MCH5477207.1 ABC transporter permease [Bacillus cereus]MDA2067777.1 ABC transporter permease [Bacillus cereus]MDA2079524.1 ABC transporter permease [Bacillus cereus]
MISLLRSEFLKLKRKRFIFVIILMSILEIAWVFALTAKARQEFHIWDNLISNFGILNGLFVPIMIATIVSRLVDVEHKENTWKMLLATPINKASLYICKIITTMILLLIPLIILFFSMLIIGNVLDYPGSFPINLILKFLATTWISSIAIVALQTWVSVLIKNQAFSLTVGILGSFLGYLGQMVPISKFLIWTYPSITGPLMLKVVGNQMTYQPNVNALSNLFLSIGVGIILILVGLNHFMKKDTN